MTMRTPFTPHPLALALSLATAGGLFPTLAVADVAQAQDTPHPPGLEARQKPLIEIDGGTFKDLNANGRLDGYEDWRLPVEARVDDLVARMTLEEKAGLMLIDTLNASCEGAVPAKAFDFVHHQQMHRFIFRNVVTPTPSCGPDNGFRAGSSLTPTQAATYTNLVQEMSEATRLGIPSLFKSNARNHYEKDPRAGINAAAGAFTEFPKEAGLAAAALGKGDMSGIRTFASVMGDEWRSIGLRGMYGYMADLATEPRWYRVHETFTEDADLAADIMGTLVETLQGGPLTPDSAVALTMKHFPGGGPQALGLDPHFSHGKQQVYPSDNFSYHLKPFKAAIEAGVASIMPYYGVPMDVTYEGVTYDQTGMAFSKPVVTGLLRETLGFDGYVNSDTGIITDRAWGLEDHSVQERVAAAINGGTDTLSGFSENRTITELVAAGLVSEARVTQAAERLLEPLFAMGLFEDPYVDAQQAETVLGNADHRAQGLEAQRRALVLLQNRDNDQGDALLPLEDGIRLYTLGIEESVSQAHGFKVTPGDRDGSGQRPSAAGHDAAVIRVAVSNPRDAIAGYVSDDPDSGMNPEHLNPLTGEPFGAQDRCVTRDSQTCTDEGLVFGGALPWENGNLSFTTMAASESWQVSPSLDTIQAVMDEIGAENTVLSIYFRQPYVLDEASGLRDAGALLASFGVSDTALLDLLAGKTLEGDEAVSPQGRLPFALAENLEAVRHNAPDAPGYPEADTLFPFGHGLSF